MPTSQDLPNELWCYIWLHLHLRDCFSVSQVCRKWRALTLHTPNLWTRLEFYTTRHHFNCLCRDCFRDLPTHARHDSGWVNSPYPANCSNERLIAGVLDRSGGLPLHLRLDVVPYACDTATVSALAESLKPHVDRLAGISGVEPNGHTMSYFLSDFRCLPELRVFRLSLAPGCENMWRVGSGNYFPSYPIDLPRLEVLDLWDMGTLDWSESLHCPALRSLSLQARGMRDVMFALRACPVVASLRFKLADRWVPDPYHSVSVQEMREALAPVRSCRVEGVQRADEDHLLSAFPTGNMAFTSLIKQYVDFPALGFVILRDVPSSSIHLTLDGEGLVVVTAGAGAEGAHTRQIIFSAKPEEPEQEAFWRIWDAASFINGVRCVESGDAVWSAFVAERILAPRRAESD